MGLPRPRTWPIPGPIKHRAVELGIVLLGVGAATWLMWRGSLLPRSWLSIAELWAFPSLLLAAAAATVAGGRHGEPPIATEDSARWLPADALAGTLVLFSLPVAYLWATGHTTYFALGGLLPWSDAHEYHLGARHLLHEGSLNDFNMRRPLNAAFLATRLGLTGGDLQAALVMQVWLAAAAAFLAAAAIARSHGLGSGTLSLALLYEFARSFLGTTLSESLGPTFGCLAFALLWSAATTSSGSRALLGGGAALLTLGLSARAGAYGALAALVAWAAFGFRPRPAWRLALWPSAGIALALLMNSSLQWQFGTGTGAPHANFAYPLYGLVAGGKPWQQALQDHPECQVRSERDRADCIYARALQRLEASPATAARGYVVGLRRYFDRMFGSLTEVSAAFWRSEANGDRHALLPMLALTALGWVTLLRRWREPLASQLLLVSVAVLLCAPFLEIGESRVYAATMPYIAALPAVGLAVLRPRSRRHPDGARSPDAPPHSAPGRPGRAAWGLGAALAVSCTAGPWLAIALRERPRFAVPPCPGELTPTIFSLGQGSAFLHVLPDSPAGGITQLPDITRDDWRSDPSFLGSQAQDVWRKVQAGDWIIAGYDYSPVRLPRQRNFWMIVPANMSIPVGEFLRVCIRRDPRTQAILLWRVTEPTAIRPLS